MQAVLRVATVAVFLSLTLLAGDGSGSAAPHPAVHVEAAPIPLTGSDWTNMSPSDAPAGYLNMAMVYDSDADRMIAYGGYVGNDDFSNETWAYDFESNTWTNLHPAGHPDGQHLLRAAYDSGSRQTILFGGWRGTTSDGTYSSGTWGYDFSSNAWTNLTPSEHPSARSRQGMAYDSQSARTILFGGHTIKSTYDNETWAYDAAQNQWTNMTSGARPPGRRSPGMAYDSKSDRTILFGGAGTPGNDTWALTTEPGPPSAPADVWIRPGNGFLELHWQAPPDDGMSPITGYRIYRATAPGGESLFAELGDVHSWTDTDVTNGQTYYYRVSALNAYGEGPLSQELSAAPDGTPPVTSASLLGRLGNEGWWRSTVAVTLTATDDNSGVASTTYRVDGGGWQTYASPVQISGDGAHALDFYSTDLAGNVEGTRSVGFRIDATAPQTEIALDGIRGDDYWFHSAVTVSVTATDAGSGVASILYRLDGGGWVTYTAAFDGGDGEHGVDADAVEGAGWEGEVASQWFGVDTTPPITTAQIAGLAGASGWYVGAVPVNLVATDAPGTPPISVRVDGGSWTMYTSPLLFDTGVHTLDYYAVDASGLQEEVQTQTVSIDFAAPTASASLLPPSASGWYTAAIPVTITASDELSGVASIFYRIDGGAWQTYAGSFLLTPD